MTVTYEEFLREKVNFNKTFGFPVELDQINPVLKPHQRAEIEFGSVTGTGIPTVSPFHAEAIMHGRKHGFRDSVVYLRAEERKIHMPSLFDLTEDGAA